MAKKSKLCTEIICLSDDDADDDDEGEENRTHKVQPNPVKPAVTPAKPKECPTVVNQDQPTTSEAANWTVYEKDIIHVAPLPSKYTDIYKKPFEVRCATIYFGLVEFNVESDVLLMKESEFEMKLIGGFMNTLNIKLAYTDIIKFYFSYESRPPVALMQVRNEFGLLFGRFIPTSTENGRGFNPHSKDERRRHVIFCLKPLTPEMERIHMSTIFHFLKTKCPKMDIRCISGSRAEEIYNQARFAKTSVSTPTKAPFTLDTTDLMAKTVGLNNNTVRFDLSADDLHCLNEGEFLNDNIIDFYLQYIYYEKLSAEDRQRTHLFNSFFYKRLTQKDNRDNPDISAAERRYNRVKRWLRDVDLFSKNYIIVPINQNAHWYIVIIQNLNNVPTEKDLISDDEDEHFDDNSKAKKPRRSSRIIRAKSFSPEAAIELDDEPEDADEVASDDVALKVNIESLVGTKERFLAPAIIIFDSLRIASKTRVAATLREFLQLEYDHKKTLSNGSLSRKLFNIDTIPTIEAGVPQQRNYFDCGLYVLQYIESFFTHLSATIVVHASTFSNWCEKNLKGSMKRKEILNVINDHVIAKDDS